MAADKADLSKLGLGWWRWDIRSHHIEWSPELKTIFGLSVDQSEEITFERLTELIHPSDRATMMSTVSQTLVTRREGHEQRFRIVRASDKQVILLLSRARLELDEAGEPLALYGFDIDLGRPAVDPTKSPFMDVQPDVLKNFPLGVALLDQGCRWTAVNAHFCKMTGYDPVDLIGLPASSFLTSDDIDIHTTHIEMIKAGAGEAASVDKRLVKKDGSLIWVSSTLECVRTPSGEVDYFIEAFQDVSTQKMVEARQKLLMNEFAHRSKNLLAVVNSIARRTIVGARTLDEARTTMLDRITALAGSFDAMPGSTNSLELHTILQREVLRFSDRVVITGPTIRLAPRACQGVALIAHELATNAVKHGALSVSSGVVAVSWSVVDDSAEPRLMFEWKETGGPPAITPTRRGFGTLLLTDVTGAEFLCNPAMIYDRSGFLYKFDAPLEAIGGLMRESPVRQKLKHPLICSFFDSWARHATEELPQLAGFDWGAFSASGAMTIAKISLQKTVRFIQVGRALKSQLGNASVTTADEAPDLMAHPSRTYLICAEQSEPCHELVRMDFGDGDPFVLERLLLPFTSVPGGRVTHVVGIVVINGSTNP